MALVTTLAISQWMVSVTLLDVAALQQKRAHTGLTPILGYQPVLDLLCFGLKTIS